MSTLAIYFFLQDLPGKGSFLPPSGVSVKQLEVGECVSVPVIDLPGKGSFLPPSRVSVKQLEVGECVSVPVIYQTNKSTSS